MKANRFGGSLMGVNHRGRSSTGRSTKPVIRLRVSTRPLQKPEQKIIPFSENTTNNTSKPKGRGRRDRIRRVDNNS